jgi:hypothetical protein
VQPDWIKKGWKAPAGPRRNAQIVAVERKSGLPKRKIWKISASARAQFLSCKDESAARLLLNGLANDKRKRRTA